MVEIAIPSSAPAAALLRSLRAGGPCALGPAPPRQGEWRAALAALSDAELLGGARLADEDAARALRAGLLLFGDDFEASHRLSQSVETTYGSWWHGILHRREPDYDNARYWFRRVGPDPLLGELARRARGLGGVAPELLRGGAWDPFQMVELVEACERGGRRELRPELVALQELEMLTLLEACCLRALGAGGGKAAAVDGPGRAS